MSERAQSNELNINFRANRGLQSDIDRAVAIDRARWTDPYTFVQAQEASLRIAISPEPAQGFEPSVDAVTSWAYSGELRSSRKRSASNNY